MKNSYTFFCLIFFLFTLISCSHSSKEKICVNIEDRDKISMFDMFSKIEVIPLETNEKSLIGEISKVATVDNNYYVLDYQKSEILMFNENGNYITKISNRGDAPNQYINISDFDINISQKKISFLCPVNRTFYNYDLNCNFIDSYKLPEITGAYKSLKYLNNDTIVFWTFDNKNRIKFYSVSKNKIIKELFSEEDVFFNIFTRNEFPYGNYLCRSSQNKVLKISESGNIEDAYEWDFGHLNNNIKEMQKELMKNFHGRENIEKTFASINVNYIFTLQGGNSTYLYSQIIRKNKTINIFYNKKTKHDFVFETSMENAHFNPIYWSDEYVIGFQPDQTKSINETLPDEILNDENITKKHQIVEYDNPILVKYYFKK